MVGLQLETHVCLGTLDKEEHIQATAHRLSMTVRTLASTLLVQFDLGAVLVAGSRNQS